MLYQEMPIFWEECLIFLFQRVRIEFSLPLVRFLKTRPENHVIIAKSHPLRFCFISKTTTSLTSSRSSRSFLPINVVSVVSVHTVLPLSSSSSPTESSGPEELDELLLWGGINTEDVCFTIPVPWNKFVFQIPFKTRKRNYFENFYEPF